MALCVISIAEKYIVAKYDPRSETPAPTPSEGYDVVPVPDTLSLPLIRNQVDQDEQGNWIFSEDLQQKEQFWQAIRRRRNELLAACDWTQLRDVPSSSDWATYRQALRDLPNTTSDPTRIVWPTAPSNL
jgi:hypothetical protein